MRAARLTPEETLRSLWTRIKNCASDNDMTVEELARMPDNKLLRLPNMGKLSIAALRERYPKGKPLVAYATPPQEAKLVELIEDFKAKLEARLEVINALRALIDRLDEIHAHPAFQSVSTVHVVHGGQYLGPNWVGPLERARKALEEAGG